LRRGTGKAGFPLERKIEWQPDPHSYQTAACTVEVGIIAERVIGSCGTHLKEVATLLGIGRGKP
jgi:hypothetical protein